jgi:poly-gamma-glutamate capsule biosynthesis protein CapA/YwtB (metallophosphatase superfamily)
VSRNLVLMLCGDVNVQGRDGPADGPNGPRSAFALVKPALAEADVLFGDLEMALYRPDATLDEKPGWTQSDPAMVESLADAGFAAVGCANNVIQGAEAIRSTLATLDRHGIAHTGAGEDLAAARAPAVVERGGVRFGFLASTMVYYVSGHAAGPTSAGVAALRCHTAYEPHPRLHQMPGSPAITRSWPDPAALARLREDVTALRRQVDVLVTYFHWGVSGMDELAEYQRTVAHDAIDHGADLVVGSHAHKPQGVERYKDRAILYGLGNFAFDWVNMRPPRTGLLARCEVADKRITRVAVRPVLRRDDPLNQPELVGLDHPHGRRIADRVAELSAELGTQLRPQGDELVVLPAP